MSVKLCVLDHEWELYRTYVQLTFHSYLPLAHRNAVHHATTILEYRHCKEKKEEFELYPLVSAGMTWMDWMALLPQAHLKI